MLWLCVWIERLIVVDDEFTCQKLFMWVCFVFVKSGWIMKLWLLDYEWIHDYLLLMMSWNMLLMNWCNEYAYWWIDDENCCCCWKVVKVWWIIEFWWNDVLISSFMHHWVCFHVYMTCKLYLGRVLGVERSKLECLGKIVLKFKDFFRTDECSLKRAINELQASVPSWFWTQFAWASCKRSSKRTRM